MEHIITMTLDQRRILKNGKYPVKVRVWLRDQKTGKRFSIPGLQMTEREFKNAWDDIGRIDKLDLRGNDRENYIKLKTIYERAQEAADSMDYFNMDLFEQKLFRRASDKTSIPYHFRKTIKAFEKSNRIGAASSYNCALTSLLKFNSTRKSKKEDLSFMEVTPDWLGAYESWMIDEHGRSVTTVAIYLRSLRAIFNNARREKDLDDRCYPFGRDKYEIPEEVKVKKALKNGEVVTLYQTSLPPLQDRARDYWIFSYFCSGMNFKDIAMLRYENIQKNEISYYREKTRRKKRKKKKIIRIKLNSIAQKILDKHKNVYRGENSFVFPILDEADDPKMVHRKVLNFVRSTNQQLKHVAKKLDFPGGFSTYWARHSYATNMIELGASIEFVSEALNHSDIQVTQHYFTGFEDATKEGLMKKLVGRFDQY